MQQKLSFQVLISESKRGAKIKKITAEILEMSQK
jgi:hypothetical protein